MICEEKYHKMLDEHYTQLTTKRVPTKQAKIIDIIYIYL